MTQIPLLLPDQPLPSYSYVPGKFPHPVRDPHGHSYGESACVANDCDANNWRACNAYLRGIDLFNSGYYWEAHESWEAVWNGFGRVGLEADFIKALIKLAAALVKAREGRSNGVTRHAASVEGLLEQVQQQTQADPSSLMGLQFEVLLSYARLLKTRPQQFIDTSGSAVVRCADFELRPH